MISVLQSSPPSPPPVSLKAPTTPAVSIRRCQATVAVAAFRDGPSRVLRFGVPCHFDPGHARPIQHQRRSSRRHAPSLPCARERSRRHRTEASRSQLAVSRLLTAWPQSWLLGPEMRARGKHEGETRGHVVWEQAGGGRMCAYAPCGRSPEMAWMRLHACISQVRVGRRGLLHGFTQGALEGATACSAPARESVGCDAYKAEPSQPSQPSQPSNRRRAVAHSMQHTTAHYTQGLLE